MELQSLLRSRRAGMAFLAATALLAVGITVQPASAVQSTLTFLSTGDITSLNSSTSTGNTAYNARAAYTTGMGYTYYDDATKLVENTKFGKMSIVKNTPTLFSIKYTVVKGQTWSDGVPIDARDLLLSHIVASDEYSKSAGLGDTSSDVPAFDSVGYGGAYGSHVIGLPVLSADNSSLTVNFDQPMVDWKLLAPGPSPVYALEMIAANNDGKNYTVAQALAAKEEFKNDFYNKTTADLRKMGQVWTTGYDLADINANTNPLLLISNGGFKVVSKSSADGTLTLVKNLKYKSGPAFVKTTAPVNTLVFKVIKSNTAAVQALLNKNIDVYTNTLASAADKITLSNKDGIAVRTDFAASYSVLGLRVAALPDSDDPYTGKFAGNGKRAKDLRHAFLLALPRQQMVDSFVKTVSDKAQVMNTNFAFTGTPEYNAITAVSGVAEYSQGSADDRIDAALALVKKWYPSTSAENPTVNIYEAHAGTSSLRNNMSVLIKAAEKRAGFNVIPFGSPDLFGNDADDDGTVDFHDPDYDVTFHGFSITAVTQGTATAQFQSDGGNNEWGYANGKVDVLADQLQSQVLTDEQVTAKRVAIDKIVHDNYWGLPLYQNPTLTAYNTAVSGIKPEPIGYDVVWNFWDWHF